MPWKVWGVMDERLRFVHRLIAGEKMAPLCAYGHRRACPARQS